MSKDLEKELKEEEKKTIEDLQMKINKKESNILERIKREEVMKEKKNNDNERKRSRSDENIYKMNISAAIRDIDFIQKAK